MSTHEIGFGINFMSLVNKTLGISVRFMNFYQFSYSVPAIPLEQFAIIFLIKHLRTVTQ